MKNIPWTEIKTSPEMNDSVKNLLAFQGSSVSLYAIKLISELQYKIAAIEAKSIMTTDEVINNKSKDYCSKLIPMGQSVSEIGESFIDGAIWMRGELK